MTLRNSAFIASLIVAAHAGALNTAIAANSVNMAAAILESRSGSQVRGSATFIAAGDHIRVAARVAGLAPGKYRFHLHETGDCSAADASSAKAYFNLGNKSPTRPTGTDKTTAEPALLVADAEGNANYQVELQGLTLSEGPAGILNRAVIVSSLTDDKNPAAATSGKRLACGVIRSH